MSEQITILGDRVLVEPVKDKTLIHTIDNNAWRYKVLSVGAGRKTEFGILLTPPVVVGDVIAVSPGSVQTVDIAGKQCKIVYSHDIIAKES